MWLYFGETKSKSQRLKMFKIHKKNEGYAFGHKNIPRVYMYMYSGLIHSIQKNNYGKSGQSQSSLANLQVAVRKKTSRYYVQF